MVHWAAMKRQITRGLVLHFGLEKLVHERVAVTPRRDRLENEGISDQEEG